MRALILKLRGGDIGGDQDFRAIPESLPPHLPLRVCRDPESGLVSRGEKAGSAGFLRAACGGRGRRGERSDSAQPW